MVTIPEARTEWESRWRARLEAVAPIVAVTRSADRDRGEVNDLLHATIHDISRSLVKPRHVYEERERMINAPAARTYVARVDDRVVGALHSLRPEYLDAVAKSHGRPAAVECGRYTRVLTSLAVRPEHRRQGVGSALVAKMVLAAERLGVREVVGMMQPEDVEAAPFYEECGFEFSTTMPPIPRQWSIDRPPVVIRAGTFFRLAIPELPRSTA